MIKKIGQISWVRILKFKDSDFAELICTFLLKKERHTNQTNVGLRKTKSIFNQVSNKESKWINEVIFYRVKLLCRI